MNYQNKTSFLEVTVENMSKWKNDLVTMLMITLTLEKGKCVLSGEKIGYDNRLYSQGMVDREFLEKKITNLFKKDKKISLNFLDKEQNDFVIEVKVGDYYTKTLGKEKSVQFWQREDFFREHIISNNELLTTKSREFLRQ